MKIYRLIIIVLFVPFFWECSPDDREDFEPIRPQIVFVSDPALAGERNTELEFQIVVKSGSGISTLSIGGEDILITAGIEEDTIDYRYTIPSNAEVETTIDLPIILTDNLERSREKAFSVTVLKQTMDFPVDVVDADLALDSSFNYRMTVPIVITNNAELYVPSGTTLFTTTDSTDVEIDVESGARIIANGTASRPVVFTSEKGLAGAGEPGDWSGIVMRGGGGSSGRLSYVRIEYAESPAFQPRNVESSTIIDHVQIYKSEGLGIEARGGDVHMSHIVVTSAGGSSIEFDDDDDGYTGTMQFVIIDSSEILEKGSRDLESRDDSDVTISNITLIGSGKEVTDPDRDLSAVRIRDDAGGMGFYNMIIAEYSDDGFRFDPIGVDVSLGGDFVIANSYIFRIGDDPTRDNSDPENLPLIYETDAATYSNVVDNDNVPAEAAGIGIGDFVPDAPITANALNPTTLSGPFIEATYVGAIGSTDWTLGWVLNADGTLRE